MTGHFEELYIGIDPAKDKDWSCVAMMRVMEDSQFHILETCHIPPSYPMPDYHRSVTEILTRQAAGEQVLVQFGRRFGKTMIQSMLKQFPSRRRWDQYGAYHKRMVKKFMKNPFRLHGIGDAT